MKTITYDETRFRLMPVRLNTEMRAAFWQAHEEFENPPFNTDGPEAPDHQYKALLATAPQPECVEQTEAARDVLAERRRQIESEGFGPNHDDANQECELLRASASYVMHTALMLANKAKDQVPVTWPWAPHWWKPATPRRNLVKAAALILAEIERLDRAEAKAAQEKADG